MPHTRKNAILFAIVAWTFAVSIARTLRLPNDFAEAHWLLDYRFGFMKRGLVGTVCQAVLDAFGMHLTPGLIVALSAVIFAGLAIALLAVMLQTLRRHAFTPDALLLCLVFASSPFPVMCGHVFGYFDALLYVLAIASIALVHARRPCLAALTSAAAILAHESFLVIGLPLVFLAVLLQPLPATRRARALSGAITLGPPLLAFAAVTILQPRGNARLVLRQQLAAHLDTFGFVETRSAMVAKWQTTSFAESIHQQAAAYVERLLDPAIYLMIVSALLTILFFNHAQQRPDGSRARALLVLAVALAPLALHVVAWDTARISTYTLGSAFLAAWVLARQSHIPAAPCALAPVAIPAMFINVAGLIPLMDDATDRIPLVMRLILNAPALALALTLARRQARAARPQP